MRQRHRRPWPGAKKFVWRDTIPGCAEIFTQKKLLKKVEKKKVKTYKWVLEDLCGKCRDDVPVPPVPAGTPVPPVPPRPKAEHVDAAASPDDPHQRRRKFPVTDSADALRHTSVCPISPEPRALSVDDCRVTVRTWGDGCQVRPEWPAGLRRDSLLASRRATSVDSVGRRAGAGQLHFAVVGQEEHAKMNGGTRRHGRADLGQRRHVLSHLRTLGQLRVGLVQFSPGGAAERIRRSSTDHEASVLLARLDWPAPDSERHLQLDARHPLRSSTLSGPRVGLHPKIRLAFQLEDGLQLGHEFQEQDLGLGVRSQTHLQLGSLFTAIGSAGLSV